MSIKKDRLTSEIKQAVSNILMTEVTDPRLGFVTVMRVELSDDFRYAKVHVSIIGSDSDARNTLRCLKDARGHIQGLLGRRIKARHTPIITWVRDRSVEMSIRISEILKKDNEERS
jgi:ribosome-binding factor A